MKNKRLADQVAAGIAQLEELEKHAEEVLEMKLGRQGPIYRDFPGVEPEAANDGRLKFVISSQAPDRMGDVIVQRGIRWDNYAKNNVVLWSHQRDLPPVGRGLNLQVENRDGVDVTTAEVEWVPEGAHPLGDTVRVLSESGFLKATSVGIIPEEFAEQTKTERAEAGMKPYSAKIDQSEGFEFSLVTVPMHQDALQAGIKGLVETDKITATGAELIEKTFQMTERDYFKLVQEDTTGIVTTGVMPDITGNFFTTSLTPPSDALNEMLRDMSHQQIKHTEAMTRLVEALSDLTRRIAEMGGNYGGQAPDAGKPDARGSGSVDLNESLQELTARIGRVLTERNDNA